MSADLKKMKEDTIRWYELFNTGLKTGDFSQIDKAAEKLFSADTVAHYPPLSDLAPGAAGVKHFLRQLFTDFSNNHVTVDTMFGEGDMLAVRYTWQATNKSSGKKITSSFLNITRYDKGKIVETWDYSGPSKEE